ncbi:MAG: leucine-rich repeat protein [Muribaculaceae bacterium]|nr:leucine-rich repeat protein [Muribaculaceae bacterium]
MKKFFLISLLFSFCLIGLQSQAAETERFKVDGLYYKILSENDKTAQLTYEYPQDNAYEGVITIPSKVTINDRQYTVTQIGDSAFIDSRDLTGVLIPSTVTKIGAAAFGLCYELKEVVIPGSVTTIGEHAFGFCTALTEVSIPASVTTIAPGAFAGCELKNFKISSENPAYCLVDDVLYTKDMKTLCMYPCWKKGAYQIPETVTAIGDFSFTFCNELTDISIPATVTTIGQGAFFTCRGLTKIIIPNSVTEIGSSAFSGCSGLTDVTLSDALTIISEEMFANCEELTSIKIPDRVTTIGEGAFSGCDNLTNIVLSNSLTTIEQGAFDRTGITKINLPNSVKTIGDFAFAENFGLTEFTFPSSVNSIGVGVFAFCPNLTEINVDSANQAYSAVDNILYTKDMETLCICPGNKTGAVEIPNTVTVIQAYAFFRCEGLTSVTIPNSVMIIDVSAFDCCSGLTELTIPASVTTIGEFAFRDCKGLTRVTIPYSVTSLGSFAFNDCDAISKINVDKNNPAYCSKNGVVYTKDMKTLCMYPCGKKGAFKIPKTVTTIGEGAFANCIYLTNITIPASVSTIEDYAFSDCNSLQKVYCYAVTPPDCGRSEIGGLTLYVPSGTREAYRSTLAWSFFRDIIDNLRPQK